MAARIQLLAAWLLFVAALVVLHTHGPAAALGRRGIAWVLADNVSLPPRVVAWLRREHVPLPRLDLAAGRTAPQPRLSLTWPLPGPVSLHGDTLWVTAPTGAPVRAAAPGRVAAVEGLAGSVRTVVERSGPFTFVYGGLGAVTVRPGQALAQGERVGVLRHLGPGRPSALRFAVLRQGRPLNPRELLGAR